MEKKNSCICRTVAKISLSSSGKILETLQKDIPLESIPKALGGSFEEFNEPFVFDTSETGPFFYPGEPDRFQSKSESESESDGKSPATVFLLTSAVASPDIEELDSDVEKISTLSLSLESSSSTSSLLIVATNSKVEGEEGLHHAFEDQQGLVDDISVSVQSANDACHAGNGR